MEVRPRENDAPLGREDFVRQIAQLLSDWGARDANALRARFVAGLADQSDEALAQVAGRVSTTGGDWGFHPGDDVARIISRLFLEHVIDPPSELLDAEHARIARDRPVVLMGNHLSFVDANVLDALMAQAGFGDVAERFSVVVGPKVYGAPIRRLASLCFGTIKIPQSTTRASGEAVMSARDVARLARQSLTFVTERLDAGDVLLVFPEGTRSREASMARCLAAVTRYMERPDVVLLPFGLWGTEDLVPVGDDRVQHARVHARLGAPVEAATLFERADRHRNVVADAVGHLIAALLPEKYRGIYDGTHDEVAEGGEVAASVRS